MSTRRRERDRRRRSLTGHERDDDGKGVDRDAAARGRREAPDAKDDIAGGNGARNAGGSAEGAVPRGNGGHPATASEEEVDLLEKIEELNGKWLRALADLDNYKKRVERDRARMSGLALEQLVLPILAVLDNFERALGDDSESEACPDTAFRDGIKLIFKQLTEVLEGQGLTPIEAVGREFDPNFHEAVAQIESGSHESNHIVEETAKGYMLGDRLLRAAKVVVAK
jgi:molecular chaperone GrpE